jgi:hypothetical protein
MVVLYSFCERCVVCRVSFCVDLMIGYERTVYATRSRLKIGLITIIVGYERNRIREMGNYLKYDKCTKFVTNRAAIRRKATQRHLMSKYQPRRDHGIRKSPKGGPE